MASSQGLSLGGTTAASAEGSKSQFDAPLETADDRCCSSSLTGLDDLANVTENNFGTG